MTDPPDGAGDLARLGALINGHVIARTVHVAARIGLPDALGDSTVDAGVLAERTGCDPDALRRLLRHLAALDIVVERPAGYSLTSMGHLLRTGHPRSVGSITALCAHPALWQAWGALEHSVRSGDVAFDVALGMPFWQHLTSDASLATAFDAAMGYVTEHHEEAILSVLELADVSSIVDVGGGNGKFLARLLAARPHLSGVVLDTPQALEGARELIEGSGVLDRCRIERGSFFESVPAGAGAYLLKNVLHNWNDEQAGAILRNCRRAMRDGQLLVVSAVLPEMVSPASGADAARADLEMMVMCPGRERSIDEFGSLFSQAGFRMTDRTEIDPASGTSVLRAVPA